MLVYARPQCCRVCDAGIEPYLDKVEDRVYGVPGQWRFVRCVNPSCGVIYLDHDLTGEQLAGFYEGYGTHSSPVLAASGIKRLYRSALGAVQDSRLGYRSRRGVVARVAGAIAAQIPFFRESALSRVFWLPAKPGGRVLEVGFGNAQGMTHLRDAGWDVVGCEFDDVCIRQARSLGFDVHHGSLIEAGFPADSFDAVVASHTIEHVPDPVAFIREAARVLRKGGHLVLLTPNAASSDAARFGRDWRGLEAPRHLSIHTPGSLRRMAQDAGFTGIEVFGTPLGGFIRQQSRELGHGRKASSRQSLKTMPHNAAASLIAATRNLASEEIVLRCEMPG